MKSVNEYKLKGERNNQPRQPLVVGDRLFVIFVYDKKSFIESRVQCLRIDTFELIWEYIHPHVINNVVMSSNQTLLASCMNGQVIAFDIATGQHHWQFKTDESNIGFLSNAYNGKVVCSGIQAGAKSTWCLSAHDGAVVWKQTNSGHAYVPCISNNKIYNTIGNTIFCLTLHDGSTIWSHHEPQTFLFNPHPFREWIVATGHGLINFYHAETGELQGAIQTGQRSAIRQPVFDETAIYFGDEQGTVYCYEILEEPVGMRFHQRWTFASAGRIASTPLLSGDRLLLLNDAPKFLMLDKHTGTMLFEKKIKGSAQTSGITQVGRSIYFSCGGGLVCHWEE